MFYVKFFFVVFIFISLFTTDVNAECSDADAKIINDCFITNIFTPLNFTANVDLYLQKFLVLSASPIGIRTLCGFKKNLDKCLSVSTSIENCFDVEDFKKVGFINGEENDARIMVTNYLQMKYFCGEVYNLAQKTVACIERKDFKHCDANIYGCDNFDEYKNCEVLHTNDTCGKAAACFIKKYFTLEACYFNKNCSLCLSFVDKPINNPLDNICDDDNPDGNDTTCSTNDAESINECYMIFFKFLNISSDPIEYRKVIEQFITSSNSAKQVCSEKKDLDDCVGISAIQNCFNIKDFQNVSFVSDEQGANIMVTNYIQLDYACDWVYDLTLTAVDCIFSNVIGCDNHATTTCDDYTKYINCEKQRTTQTCGEPAGCFIEKHLTLETCYDFAKCNNICYTYATTNFKSNPVVDGICNEDEGGPLYPANTTTPITPLITSPSSVWSTTTSIIPTSTPNSDDKNKINKAIIIAIASVSILVILILVSFCIIKRRIIITKKKKFEEFQADHRTHLEEKISETNEDSWELAWDKIQLKDEKLGAGAYGEVIKGKLISKLLQNEKLKSGSKRTNASFNVAVKMLHKYSNEKTKDEFANEIKIMKLINGCSNIVAMFGCITTELPMCLVLEYCDHRDLLQYVKIRKINIVAYPLQSVNDKDFAIFAWQIARGMNFLTSKGIIHRDLAARNVLIDANKNAKISDFGLCIHFDGEDGCESNIPQSNVLTHESERFPIKWLAIECLERYEFSFKSDVWSFGILLYEIYSFGTTPFKKIEPESLLEHLKCGNRLEQPEICPPDIYEIMQNSWNEIPLKRPSFEEILESITKFLENSTEGYGYLTLLKAEKN